MSNELNGHSATFQFRQGTDLSKIMKLVEAYNKRATKYEGFDLWSFDEATCTLSGSLKEKSPELGLLSWKGAKAVYQFGELESDFKKICAEAEKICIK